MEEGIRLLHEYQEVYTLCGDLRKEVDNVELEYGRACQSPNSMKMLAAFFSESGLFILRILGMMVTVVAVCYPVLLVAGLACILFFRETIDTTVNPALNEWEIMIENWLIQHSSSLPANLSEWMFSNPNNLSEILMAGVLLIPPFFVSFLCCTIFQAWRLWKTCKISRETAYNRLHMEELEAKRAALKKALEKAQSDLDSMDENNWGVFSRDYAEQIEIIIRWMEDSSVGCLKEAMNLMDDIRYRQNVYDIVRTEIESQNESLKISNGFKAGEFKRRIKETLEYDSTNEEFYSAVHDWLDYQEKRVNSILNEEDDKLGRTLGKAEYWEKVVYLAQSGYSRWGKPLNGK